MNKAVVKRLKALAKLMQQHEERLEKKFNPKTVAIVKYRVGLEDGTQHSMEETATYFKVSTTWVGKATRQIKDFATKLNAGGKNVSPTRATIVGGTVKSKDADLQNRLQQMVDYEKQRDQERFALGTEAIRLQKAGENKGVVSFIALLAGLVIAMSTTILQPELDPLRSIAGYLVSAVFALIGLILFVRGVSCFSERNGLLKAIRKLG